jgi:putative transposase
MIRTSKHNIVGICNSSKLEQIDLLFVDYKHDLGIYIDYIIDGFLPLKKHLSSKVLPSEKIAHSRYKQLIYKQASEIIRSQMQKASERRFRKYQKIYSYFSDKHSNSQFVKTKFSELNLKDIIKSKYFTTPNLKNISISLDERFFDIKEGFSFDNFVKIILPTFNKKGTRALKIHIPIKQHKHSIDLAKRGFCLKNNIQLKQVGSKTFINLVWFKEEPPKKQNGKTIGVDLGVNKLIVSSNKQYVGTNLKSIYEKIRRKQKNSKAYYRALDERTNLTNFFVNQLCLNDINKLIIEDLKGVKKNSSFKNIKNKKFKKKTQEKINDINSKWLYPLVISKLNRICEEKSILLVKVSPAYTSQTCFKCGNIDKNSRKGEKFNCVNCGYEIDADLNAAINIQNRGVYSLSAQKNTLT